MTFYVLWVGVMVACLVAMRKAPPVPWILLYCCFMFSIINVPFFPKPTAEQRIEWNVRRLTHEVHMRQKMEEWYAADRRLNNEIEALHTTIERFGDSVDGLRASR